MNEVCDRHPSAKAQARVLLPSLRELYFCSHCATQFGRDYHGDYHVEYETVSLSAKS